MSLTMFVVSLLGFLVAFVLPLCWYRYSKSRTVYIHCHAVCTVLNDRRWVGSGESKIAVSVPVRGDFIRKISRWKTNTWKGEPVLANVTLVKRPLQRLAIDKLVFADGWEDLPFVSYSGFGYALYYAILAMAAISFAVFTEIASMLGKSTLADVVLVLFLVSGFLYIECCVKAARFFINALRKDDCMTRMRAGVRVRQR